MTKTYNCQTRDGLKNLTEEDIYRETQPIIWSVLLKKYGNFERYHEDISQDVMLEVFRAMDRYEPTEKGTVYGYIKVIALRRISDAVGKITRQEKHYIPLSPEMESRLQQSARVDPEPDEELAPLLEKLRRKLTARERKVLALKEDGYSSVEIYMRLYPKTKNKRPGQAISKIMVGIAEKAKKLGLGPKGGGKT